MKKGAGRQRIHILVPTLQPNDAVGNDAAGMYRALTEAGYDVVLLAEHIHPDVSRFTIKATEEDSRWSDPKALLIYHHAIAWELGERILNRTANRVAIKYHNVTPAEFFASYSEFYYWACVQGREATARLAARPDTWIWGDSAYNNEEFIGHGVPRERCRVLPPLHQVEDLGRADFDNIVLGSYRGGSNILFVGGMRPNKGHNHALETLAELRRHTALPVRLIFAGNFDPNLASYTADLEQYMRHLDVSDDVVFARSVTASQLRSFYMTASVFLCVSEHEGFCVPLVESMAFRVPIVAWATTAVGETAGDCALTTPDFDPEQLAAHVATCLEDHHVAREMGEMGRVRYEEKFQRSVIQAQLLALVEEAMLT